MLEQIDTSAAVHGALVAARIAAAPPTELTVSQFADQELVVTSGPLSGTRWQTDFAPYQRGILDAVHEQGVEFVVVMGSSQWGKTACMVAIVAYHIAHNPCEILIVEPTVKPMAEDFSKNRLDPVIRASPALDEVVDKKRSKDASNTILLKTFRGGFVALAGSNSAASLAARAIRVLALDEVDRYERQLKGEGDTISVALKRTTSFRNRRRVIMTSSPSVIGAPIHSWYEKGDRRRYHVPCPGCGTFHPYEWQNVRWENHDPTTARLVCPHCGYAIDEAERVALLHRGQWVADTPGRLDTTIVSFHVWEAYSPLSSLTAIVRTFLHARAAQKAGDPSLMHTFQNTTLGEPVEPDQGEGVESHSLLLRREDFGQDVDLPDGVCIVTMGVDTQDDRLELLVVGWGLDDESWIIDRQVFPGDTERPEPWADLDRAIAVEYRHARGVRLPISKIAVDTRGHRTTVVYHYAARWASKVYAIIGQDGQRAIVSTPSPRRFGQGERQVPLYTIGVDSAKALLMSRLKLTDKGPGYIHLPTAAWCDDEFAAQLTSERLKVTFEGGIRKEKWIKVRTRNEALDCYVYALGAFLQQQPDQKRRQDWLVQLQRELRGDVPPPASPTPPARPGWIPQRTNWLGGRR